MIGVTLFGIFLTPVFYFALSWLARYPAGTRKPAPPRRHRRRHDAVGHGQAGAGL